MLLNAYLDAGDRKSAAALASDAGAWSTGNAGAPARVHAQVAQARWAALGGDASAALDHYQQALALARDFGAPLVLRDAAVPYAQFQLDAGATDLARATASVVGPYAEDDFAIALLMARVAAATHDEDARALVFRAGAPPRRRALDPNAGQRGGPAGSGRNGAAARSAAARDRRRLIELGP